MSGPILSFTEVEKAFPIERGLLRRRIDALRAVDRVSFEVANQETVGLVGESGSGKTTIGRLAMGFLAPDQGEIRVAGDRRRLQMVFQDPASSLNPRHDVARLLGAPLALLHGLRGAAQRDRALELLRRVGLDEEHLDRLPHELSGGQRQRVAIARALTAEPALLVLDEALASLDLSVRAQIQNLLVELRAQGLAYLFITHDLSQVRHLADRVLVLYLGQIVESGPAQAVLSRPAHPYALSLLDAEPSIEPRRRRLLRVLGTDEAAGRPEGCLFHPRCPKVERRCKEERPGVTKLAEGREVRCHYPEVS